MYRGSVVEPFVEDLGDVVVAVGLGELGEGASGAMPGGPGQRGEGREGELGVAHGDAGGLLAEPREPAHGGALVALAVVVAKDKAHCERVGER